MLIIANLYQLSIMSAFFNYLLGPWSPFYTAENLLRVDDLNSISSVLLLRLKHNRHRQQEITSHPIKVLVRKFNIISQNSD